MKAPEAIIQINVFYLEYSLGNLIFSFSTIYTRITGRKGQTTVSNLFYVKVNSQFFFLCLRVPKSRLVFQLKA